MIINKLWKEARAGSVHVVVRHASVEVQVHCVNVVIGVLVVHVVLLVVRVVPVFTFDAVIHRTLFLIAHSFLVANFQSFLVSIFLYWR